MAFFGEVDFSETARDAELVKYHVVSEAWHHGGQEGHIGPFAALDEIAVEDPGSDSTGGERGEGAAVMAAGITQLQPARQDRSQPNA